jgi:hypothetical protein
MIVMDIMEGTAAIVKLLLFVSCVMGIPFLLIVLFSPGDKELACRIHCDYLQPSIINDVCCCQTGPQVWHCEPREAPQ